mgnify:CR=1 FL=1
MLYAAAHFLGWNGTYGSAQGSVTDPTILIGFAGTAARSRALRLHRHDLRVPAVPARMGDAADRDQLHAARASRRGSRWPQPPRWRRRRSCGSSRRARWSSPLLGFAGRVASLAAQRAPAPEVDAADRHRHQASAHRPDVAGIHGRLVQHARVLPRPERRRSCARSGGVFLLGAFAVPALLLAAGLAGAPKSAIVAGVRRAVPRDCSPSAGTSSRRRTIRRTSTTRRSRSRDAVPRISHERFGFFVLPPGTGPHCAPVEGRPIRPAGVAGCRDSARCASTRWPGCGTTSWPDWC